MADTSCPYDDGSNKFNWFSAVLGTLSVVFPASWGLLKVIDKLAEYLNSFLLSADSFTDILNNINFFIPLDFILFLVFLYYTLMLILLVVKWTLKIIPFVG